MLEPCAGKLARTVLRGGDGSNAIFLPGDWHNKLDLLRRSVGAFWDALLLQPSRWEDEMFQDLRYGLRMLLKNPGFTVVAVLTLALGIGVNTALFTLFNAVALRSLPVKDPDSIVKVYRKESGKSSREVSGSLSMFSYPEYTGHRDNTQVFSGLTAYADTSLTLGGAEAESGLLVAENYFSVLGAEMGLGCAFAPEEGRTPGASPVVVLSHGFWQRRFGADASLIGKSVILNRQPFTVVGVTARDFNGAELSEISAPRAGALFAGTVGLLALLLASVGLERRLCNSPGLFVDSGLFSVL